MGWAEMRDRMHERVVAHLNDGCAQYQGFDGAPAQSEVTVIIDRNLMQSGPEGMFRSDAVGVSWRKCQLATVVRGGIFTYGDPRSENRNYLGGVDLGPAGFDVVEVAPRQHVDPSDSGAGGQVADLLDSFGVGGHGRS